MNKITRKWNRLFALSNPEVYEFADWVIHEDLNIHKRKYKKYYQVKKHKLGKRKKKSMMKMMTSKTISMI